MDEGDPTTLRIHYVIQYVINFLHKNLSPVDGVLDHVNIKSIYIVKEYSKKLFSRAVTQIEESTIEIRMKVKKGFNVARSRSPA